MVVAYAKLLQAADYYQIEKLISTTATNLSVEFDRCYSGGFDNMHGSIRVFVEVLDRTPERFIELRSRVIRVVMHKMRSPSKRKAFMRHLCQMPETLSEILGEFIKVSQATEGRLREVLDAQGRKRMVNKQKYRARKQKLEAEQNS